MTYAIGRRLFLRSLGLVYLIAFVSLWLQIDGLVGSDGILPVGEYLDWVRELTGAGRYWQVPTLLWVADGNVALHVLCGAGTGLSIALLVGLAPIPVLFSLWVIYLSLAHGAQTFLGFQWDVLLLEAGFCALFVAPVCWRIGPRERSMSPPRAGLWLVWLLTFKLMFLSGAVKLLSMDDTWWNLTALDYHYWTQPLPTGVSWYADRLPAWFQRVSVLLTYAIEIALPFLIFAGHRGRRAVAVGTAFLMLVISLTGNYGFFNLLTVVLCIPLVDDGVFTRLRRATAPRATASPRGYGRLLAIPAVLLIALSFLVTVRELVRTVPPNTPGFAGRAADAGQRVFVGWSEPTVLRWIAPLRTINGYGLFRSMTTARPEIVIEGSRDGAQWVEYGFKWKPGRTDRRPRFVEPHMPRLDWQMWFAALNPPRAVWLQGLMSGILRGSPDVLGLLGDNPFPDRPPTYLRLVYYRYRFADTDERARGLWWERELSSVLTPPMTRDQIERAAR